MTITQSSTAPLFVVIGSTGIQGTSVIDALKNSSAAYRVRAITRDTTQASAKDRHASGCEVVSGNVDSVASLSAAFTEADYVFAMTLAGYGPGVEDPEEKEYQQGKNQVDASKAAGVKVFIWASLPSTSKLSGGKYPAAHFDSKARVADYARSLASATFKVIEIQPGIYFNMFYTAMAPQKAPDGSYVIGGITDEERPLPILDTEADFGKFVIGALEHGGLDLVIAASEYTTSEQRIAVFTKYSGGKIIRRIKVDEEVVKTAMKKNFQHGELGAQGVINVFYTLAFFGYYGDTELTNSHSVLPSPVRTFEQAAEAHKAEIEKLFA